MVATQVGSPVALTDSRQASDEVTKWATCGDALRHFDEKSLPG
jgi:hypothetical protein